MKKISIVSTVPTHPTNAGNRIRILNLIKLYQSKGLEVHFLYVPGWEGFNETEMRSYFGDKLHIIKPSLRIPIMALPIKILSKLHKAWQKLLNLEVNYVLDSWYPFSFHKHLMSALHKIEPDLVQVEYVWLSFILKFIRGPIKIIDIHDVFTDRNKRIGNKTMHLFSVSKKQESIALERADYCLAITGEELSFLKEISRSVTILNVGHIMKDDIIKASPSSRLRVGFIGSDNLVNVKTIHNIMAEINGTGLDEFDFIFAGKITNFITDNKNNNVKIIAECSLEEFYSQIDVLYNPTHFSTGLKIKNVEALYFGKQLITTYDGAQGISDGINKHFYCVEDFPSLKECLQSIKNKPSIQQRDYIIQKMQLWENNLNTIINSKAEN